MAAGASTGFLQESYGKIGNSVITLWAHDGRELARVAKGDDRFVEVAHGAGGLRWSGSDRDSCETLTLHPETTWLRVVRASEGALTTWRLYRRRPPANVPISCGKGHPLQKCLGTSGTFRIWASNRSCSRCGLEVRKGALRWSCQERECSCDLCCSCAEVAALALIASGEAVAEPSEGVLDAPSQAARPRASALGGNPVAAAAGAPPLQGSLALQPAAAGDRTPVQWFFSSSGGRWDPQSVEDSATLEAGARAAKLQGGQGKQQLRLGPNKQQYLVDFELMEQRNLETGKVRALRRGAGVAESSSPGLSIASSPSRPSAKPSPVYQMGDAVECYSVSQKQWLPATVTGIKDNVVTVSYTVRGAQAIKTLPSGHEHLRRPPASETSGSSSRRPGSGAAQASTATRRATFLREDDKQTLHGVPFLGIRPLVRVQADTIKRLQRLIRHGDLHGARRTLLRARQLGAAEEDLASPEAELQALEADGEFCLLLPRAAGA